MPDDIDVLADALEQMSGMETHDNAAVVAPGERPCPICGEHMHVDDLLGFNLDVCDQHGVWLDAGELPALIARVRSGERIGRRDAIRRAESSGTMSALSLGALALLID